MEGRVMFVVVWLFVVLSVTTTKVFGKPIVDGVEIAGDAMPEYSFMTSLQKQQIVALQHGFEHFCGGTMIHPNWILTAAHCLDGKDPQSVTVVIGQRLVDIDSVERYNATRVELYGYDKYSLRNDIALVQIQPGNSNVKSLPLYMGKIPYGEKCKIVGYGATEYTGKTPNPLSMAYVTLMTNGKCIDILGRIMGPQLENVCALGDGTDTCQGDSGGPLICEKDDQEYILGVTSSGSGCGIRGVPSLYTLVGPYRDWINKIIKSD